ncbi:MAG: TIGR02679 family protein, partial [Xanthobacteraceae bacterium]
TADERAALASLLGRPARLVVGSMQVDVAVIDAALQRAGIAESLCSALEQLDGPIVHAATARGKLEAAWSDVVDGCRHPGLAELLQTAAGIGLLKRLSTRDPEAAARLRRRAEAVLERLPANGIPRAQLAADVLGDAHALDSGEATATVVLAVWRRVMAPAWEVEDALPDARHRSDMPYEVRDERARDVWARAGVLVNELARPAMFLNLPTLDRGNREGLGEPGYVSLRSLVRSPPRWAVTDRSVFVCENPNLLAIAADALGPRCAPMVCTDGMPAAAQRTLLTQLARAGARLRYHGDFDWPGVRIGNHVMRQCGAQPWRFGAVEYAASVQSAACPGHPLAGQAVIASWDEVLAPAMQTHQLAIAEEAVAASLLRDLED